MAQHKMPLSMRLLRFAFNTYEAIFPKAAARWGVKLFLTTFRYPVPEREKKVLANAKRLTYRWNDQDWPAYAWGEGPLVIFMHGWSGRGLQVSELVEPLTKAGFRVMALDTPAHGESPGKSTNLIEMTECLMSLQAQVGEVHTLIGHSMGGSVSYYAIEQGVRPKKVITVSTPTIGDDIIDEFLRRVNGRKSTGEYIKNYVYELKGRHFHEYTAGHIAQFIPNDIEAMIVHDKNDPEAPISHAEKLLEVLPRAEHYFTEKLGHTRILRDPEVINRITEFVASPVLAEEPK